MLTTRSQKFIMFCIGFFALLLSAVVLVPFKSIYQADNILLIEALCKLVLIPIIIILLSIYPNKLKYIQVKGYREQSRIVSVLSYFPAVVYLGSLIIASLYLLTQGYVLNGAAPMGLASWNLWFVALLVSFVLVVCAYSVLPKYEMQLNVSEHVILDVCIFIVVLCFGFMYYIILKSTNHIFLEIGPKGDKFLLVVYLGGIIGFVALLGFIRNTIQRDEVNINIRMNDLDAKSFVARVAEYNRAYNDIMDNFENFFSEEGSLSLSVEEQEVIEDAAEEAELIEESVQEEVPAVLEEQTEEVQEEVAEAVVEEQVEEVQEEVAEMVAEEQTEEVQEEVAEAVVEEQVEEVQEEVAEMVAEEQVEEVQEEVAEAVAEEQAEEVQEEVAEMVAEEQVEEVQEEVAEMVAEEQAEEVQEEVAEEVKEEPQVVVVQSEELEEILTQIVEKSAQAALLEAEIEQIKKEKIEAEEARLAEEAAKQQEREIAARLAEEKALRNKAEMQPSFKKLVSYTKSLEGLNVIEDDAKKQVRFLYGKKAFLVLTDTPKDYRLVFMVDPAKVVEWWNVNPEIRPRSNKKDNWFKLTNKGSFTEELLLDIITSSREFVIAETERIAAEKAKAKEEAKAKAKAEKEAKKAAKEEKVAEPETANEEK